MNYDLLSLVVGAVAAFITTLPVLIPAFRDWRNANRQSYKFVYVKVVHLTRRTPGRPPVYHARVARLDEEVPVFDEYHYFRLNMFRQKRGFTCTDRSSGVVDLQVLHPWSRDGALVFPDVGAGKQPGMVSQAVEGESNVFFTKSIYYNGLQPGNEDLAMRMEHDTREARMIVDFSSIPDCEALVPMPTAVARVGSRETQITVRKLARGIYTVCEADAREDSVVRMDFHFAWDAAGARRAGGRR
ncbi:MAG: hypothetical protein JWM27_1590 [Gemmatimonadetes bacterium]|nr:hypothetical protein [Gemmatimonadota bacterium]